MGSEDVICVDNLVCSFDTTNSNRPFAVDHGTLTVREGEILVLLGPSGCGKTTLLRSIAGLNTPDSGTIKISGEPVFDRQTNIPCENRQVGMVFQEPALFPHMTLEQNIAFGLPNQTSKGKAALIANTWLDKVGLAGFGKRKPASLSGGEAQRVALARALAPDKPVLLLDEPFSALDTNLRTQLRNEVRTLLKDHDCSAIFVTHDQDEAFAIADKLGVMFEGRILQIDEPAKVYTTPASGWVASFLGEANIIAAEVSGATAQTFIGAIPLSAPESDGPAKVVIRPEHLTVSPGSSFSVTHRSYFGHDVVYTIESTDGVLEVRCQADRYDIGSTVEVQYVGPGAYPLTANAE